jgi:hypothetical protein
MTRSTLILLGSLASLALARSATAQPANRIPVTEMRPLLMRAVEQGSAYGTLAGVAADYMRRRFDATAPIEIDVRTLHPLPQAGCSRLEVTTHQRDVLEQGTRTDKALTYQVSFCRDGRLPEKR